MGKWFLPLWLIGGTVAVSLYTYGAAAKKYKFDGGAFWLVLALGPIAFAVMIAEMLGSRAASAIEARSDATPKSGAAEGESAAPKGDAQ